MTLRPGAVAAALLLLPLVAAAQVPDTLVVDLEAVQVRAARLGLTAADAPLAVAVEARGPHLRATEPGESLKAVLQHLPGLWVADRENFALGERLTVRGMGARAPFGVRGVHVVLDGIPLTMADGQSAIAIADPGQIRRAELIRGPASLLWGNSSGGVLFLSTIPHENHFVEARLTGGTFGLARADLEAAYPVGDGVAGLAVSHLSREGFRDHSAFSVTRGRVHSRMNVGNGAILTTLAAFELAPRQEHPGALTAEELAADPRRAQESFVAQAAGKDSRQGQLGLALRTSTRAGRVDASLYGLARSMENPLPFAYVDLSRLAAGFRLTLERTDGPVTWVIGVATTLQRDDRQNWANVQGSRGELRLDQLETVAGGAAFAQARIGVGRITLSGGLRYDATAFEADDRLQLEHDHSGRRVLGAVSPSVGASARVGGAVVFASFGTAFETPTTTELVNRPDGSGGFNPDIEPQRAAGLEAGIRGTDAAGRVYYDLAVFRLAIRDQLTPFEGVDGRTYFRNVEASSHSGVEALLEWQLMNWLRLGATYAWSHFVFNHDPATESDPGSGALAGNRIPGIPEHRLSTRARVTVGDAFAHLSVLSAGHVFADDANMARADGFTVVDIRLGYAGIQFARGRLIPFIQVQNLFDERYAGSVALNAVGGRYYEPAAGRSLQVGISGRLIP